jgi:hypothetical protein
MQIGYCANVHPGRTLVEAKSNLDQYAVGVQQEFSPSSPLNVGLWLSSTALQALQNESSRLEFRDWLQSRSILPFTFNGFPFGDFHQPVVKHDVYLPTWADAKRLLYTIRLAEIQDSLLPRGLDGTISTLPLGWPAAGKKKSQDVCSSDPGFFSQCRVHLIELANRLSEIREFSGRQIRVCIEPEPGCWLDNADDVVAFFDFLLTGQSNERDRILEHLGVCHDVCHSAVMFESQSEALDKYRSLDLTVGKTQVSSAIDVDFDALDREEQSHVLSRLCSFAEPRYLHQTSVVANQRTTFFEDLPDALRAVDGNPTGHWRVHFHVPIFLDGLDGIGTTRDEICQFLRSIRSNGMPCHHFEIETYAWNVLPSDLQTNGLTNDLVRELKWFRDLAADVEAPPTSLE